MTPDIAQFVRVAKRVSEATGYLELGMAQHTLDRLENLGPVGPFETEINLLRGEALRRQNRWEDAAVALQAAEKPCSAEDKSAWLALSACYQQAGSAQKAVEMLARARGAYPDKK